MGASEVTHYVGERSYIKAMQSGGDLSFVRLPYTVPYGLTFAEIGNALVRTFRAKGKVRYRIVHGVRGATLDTIPQAWVAACARHLEDPGGAQT